MSKYTQINSATTTTLAQASGYVVNSSRNKIGSNNINISKISITNYSASNAATVSVFLHGLTVARTVNQANGTVTKIIFDQENYISASNRIEVGDSVYDSDTTLHGTITALNPDVDNTKEITISSSTAITNDETFNIGKLDHYIAGPLIIPAGVTLVLDDPFSINLMNHELRITNTGTSPLLTVRID